MKVLFAAAALLLATPAQAELVELPFSGSLSRAFGDFFVGQKFAGTISYDRQFYDDTGLYPHDISFSFSIGDLNYSTASSVTYASFDHETGVFSLSGDRSDRTTLIFSGLNAASGYLPTATQLRGAQGTLSFATVRGTGEDSEPIFSEGEGIATVPPVPEPATWATMLLGVALAIGMTRYRLRAPKLTFA